MPELECPHGMPSPGSCTDCMADGILPYRGRRLPPSPLEPLSSFLGQGEELDLDRHVEATRPELAEPELLARFESTCRECGEAIHPGDVICQTGDGVWEHADHHRAPHA